MILNCFKNKLCIRTIETCRNLVKNELLKRSIVSPSQSRTGGITVYGL